jgi:putative ABC transport system ATP-binding protein
MIQADSVSLIYEDHGGRVAAVDDVNLEVQPGEFLGILGPSGSGKSSLLYLLSGLKSATHGRVLVDGKSILDMSDAERSELRLRDFGFIFQHPFMLGYLTAIENVLVARPGEDRTREAQQLLIDVGLGEKMDRLPHELSGGERQRVCVARALLGSPKVIFADEPTAALDHVNGFKIVEQLNSRRGSGVLIMVTHDAAMLGDANRIITIEDGKITSISQK